MNIVKVKPSHLSNALAYEAVQLTTENHKEVQMWANGVGCHEPKIEDYRLVVVGLGGCAVQAKIGQWLIKRGSLIEVLDQSPFTYLYRLVEADGRSAEEQALDTVLKAWEALPDKNSVNTEWHGWVHRMSNAMKKLEELIR